MLYMCMFLKGKNWIYQVVADYAMMGFPDCVGSMDATHLMWKQYPSALRHVCN